jgi:hypothetical protein
MLTNRSWLASIATMFAFLGVMGGTVIVVSVVAASLVIASVIAHRGPPTNEHPGTT